VLFGAHCGGGVKGAIDRAVEIGANAVQLFVQSPRAWRFPDHDPAVLAACRDRRAEVGMGAVLVHALYLVNLASEREDFYEKSASTMRLTAEAASAIGAEGVCFHVGSHLGTGLEGCLDRIAAALSPALDACSGETWLLVENTAGAGGTIGRSVEELAMIVDRLDRHPRLGLCLDSCHLYASGYDVTDPQAVDRLLAEVDDRIGLDRLRALHINDSKAPLGSNRDRHDGVLAGLMGERLGVFVGHPALQHLPAVIETGVKGGAPEAIDVATLGDLNARWATNRSRRPRAPARARGTRGRRGGARRTRG
jgi:deoxyribonuclease IV